MAVIGVLKPAEKGVSRELGLTETDLLVESESTGGLLGQDFLVVKEHAELLLESSFSLNASVGKRKARDVLGCQSCCYWMINTSFLYNYK